MFDFAFRGVFVAVDAGSHQGVGQDVGRVVLVELILFYIKLVKVVFTQPLEMTDVFVADDMASLKGRALGLAGPDLGDVMGQLGSDSVFDPYCSGHANLLNISTSGSLSHGGETGLESGE